MVGHAEHSTGWIAERCRLKGVAQQRHTRPNEVLTRDVNDRKNLGIFY